MQRDDLLVWIDLEMTSVADVLKDKITEIAVILTDKNLNIVAEGPDIIIHVEPKAFTHVPQKLRDLFAYTHLEELTQASTTTAQEAETQVLAFLKEYIAPQSAPLCGNSIHVDRAFLRVQMPTVHRYLFYRCIDVSSIKELARRWAPDIYTEAERRKVDKKHRAKDDILQSIDELRFYRDTFLKI